MTHCCGISSCAGVFLCCGWSAPASDFGFALWSLWHRWLPWSRVPPYRLLSRPWLAPCSDWGRLGWPSRGRCLKDRLQTGGDTWWSYTLWWQTWRSDWRAGRSPGGSTTPRPCGSDRLAARCCGGIEWRAETGPLSSSSLSPRGVTHSRLRGWLSFSEPLWCRTRAPPKPAESRSRTAPSRSSFEPTSASGCWWGCAEVWWRSMRWTWWWRGRLLSPIGRPDLLLQPRSLPVPRGSEARPSTEVDRCTPGWGTWAALAWSCCQDFPGTRSHLYRHLLKDKMGKLEMQPPLIKYQLLPVKSVAMIENFTLFCKQGSEGNRFLWLDQAGGPGVAAVWQRTNSENKNVIVSFRRATSTLGDKVYLSTAAGLSLVCTELGPQVLPFFFIPFFTSSNSSGL